MKTANLAKLMLGVLLFEQTSEARLDQWPSDVEACTQYQGKYCENLLCLCYVGSQNPKDNILKINADAVEACNHQFVVCRGTGQAVIEEAESYYYDASVKPYEAGN